LLRSMSGVLTLTARLRRCSDFVSYVMYFSHVARRPQLPLRPSPRVPLRLCGRFFKCFPRQVLSSLVDPHHRRTVSELHVM